MNRKRQSAYTALIIRVLLLILGLILSVIIIKKIKYSDFMQSMNNNMPVESPSVSKQPSDNYSAVLDAFLFQQDTTGTKEIGITQNVIIDNANMYYNVNYPVTGMDAIDNVLKADADAVISDFTQSFAGYNASTPDARPYLSMDYNSFLTGDSIASFALYIQYDAPDYANPVNEVHTHTFLLANGAQISPQDILAGDYLSLFALRTRNYVEANPEFYASAGEEEYSDNFSASADNFTKFTMSNSGLTLHFNPFTIAPGEFGCLSFTIPANEILPYLIYDPFKAVEVPVPPTPVPDNTPFVIDPDKPMVAITFDDGPNPGSTDRILDVLANYNCHATFFVVGNRISRTPDTVKRAREIGCDIGSHSYDHARLSRLKSSQIKKEFSQSAKAVKNASGKKFSLVRTPYGEHTKKVLSNIKYPVILWDIDTEDWKSRNKKKIIKKVIGKVKDGDIILMHDIYDTTAEAVEIIVPKLIKQGYQIVSVSEMFKAKGINLKPGKAYYYARKD